MENTTALKTITNKFAKACRNCGSNVPAGTGHAHLIPQPGGKPQWVTEHLACGNEPGVQAQPAARIPDFPPTPEQVAAVQAFETGTNLVLQAGAGAGKTSTLRLLAASAQARGLKGTYTAFNKAIVVDTADKMPANVKCMTMHALAYAAVGRQFAHRMGKGSARQSTAQQAAMLGIEPLAIPFGDGTKVLHREWLTSKAMKAVQAFAQSADEQPSARHFGYIDGVDLPTEDGDRTYDNNDLIAAHLLPAVRKAWADLSDPNGSLRFFHQVYVKVWAHNNPVIDGDFLFVDEAQDVDKVQMLIIEAQAARGMQIVVVGDEQQVIYGWRGAINAMETFENSGAKVAFLTQSFRFGKAIADVANGLLARNDARLRITGTGDNSIVGPVAEPDCILCRSNAGTVRQALSQIEAGRRPYLVGGGAEVIAFCEAALELQAGRHTTHPELSIFADWAAVQAYVANDSQGDDLKLMVKLIDEFGAATIRDALKSCPTEADADVTISTAHKSKGREWNAVQIADDFQAPKDGKELSAEELRLAYVACTRAKIALDIEAVPHMGIGWKPAAA